MITSNNLKTQDTCDYLTLFYANFILRCFMGNIYIGDNYED